MANLLLIRELCQQQNITFRHLSKRINKSESSVQSSILRGSTKVTTLESIARALGVPVGYFFEGHASDNELEKYIKENKHLKELLEEKERTIQILMEERRLYTAKK